MILPSVLALLAAFSLLHMVMVRIGGVVCLHTFLQMYIYIYTHSCGFMLAKYGSVSQHDSSHSPCCLFGSGRVCLQGPGVLSSQRRATQLSAGSFASENLSASAEAPFGTRPLPF